MELTQQEATASEVTKTPQPKIIDYLAQIFNYDLKNDNH